MAKAPQSDSRKPPDDPKGLSRYELGSIDIPELTAAEKTVLRDRPWTPEEEAILRRYYRRGMVQHIVRYLAEHFPPGRTAQAIGNKATNMGLTKRRL